MRPMTVLEAIPLVLGWMQIAEETGLGSCSRPIATG